MSETGYLGTEKKVCGIDCCGHLIAKLPFHAQQRWSRFQNLLFKKGVVADVNHLSEWLADLAMAERLLLSTKPQEPFVPSTAKPPQKFDKTKSSYPPPKTGGAFPPTILATKIEKTAVDEVKPKKKVAFGAPPKPHTPTDSTKGPKPTCFVCSGPRHSLFLCEGWGRLNLAQRIKSINDSNQCQNCCSNGHVAKDDEDLWTTERGTSTTVGGTYTWVGSMTSSGFGEGG